MPHLGLPTLAGYLASRGVACATHDLNLRFYRWLVSEGAPYERAIRDRIERFRAVQGGAPPDTPAAYGRLVRELAGAPLSLLREALADDVIWNAPKDSFDITPMLPAAQLQESLEDVLWFDAVTESIATSVPDAISKYETVMAGPFGEFLARPEMTDLLQRAASVNVVGIGVAFGDQLSGAICLARNVKAKNPNAMVVLGGSQLTLLSQDDLELLAALPFVDAVSRFEGELVIERLHDVSVGRATMADVPSIVYRDASAGGAIRTNDPVTPIALNDLPVPVFNDEEMALYSAPHIPIGVTRGCYWGKCTFCDYVKLMAPGQSRYLGRDVKRVVDDIEALSTRYGIRMFYLITEALPPAWAAHFSKEILARGVRANFWSYIKNERKEIWSQDLLCLMAAAGIRTITCGVESTSDRVLSVIDKGTTRQMIRDNFERFQNAGIRAEFNLIPDYPTTTLEEAAEGIRFVVDNRDIIPNINPHMFDLSIKSAVAGAPEEYGIEITGTHAEDHGRRAHVLSYRRTSGIADEDRALVGAAYHEAAEELRRYHLVAESRQLQNARGFRWDRARFIMSPSSRAFRSRVNLRGEDEPVVIITSSEYGAEGFAIPADYTSVVDLLTHRNRGYISFADLRNACTADVVRLSELDDASDLDDEDLAGIEESCISLATQIADGGTGRLWADLEDMRWSEGMTALMRQADAHQKDMAAQFAARPEPPVGTIRRLPVVGAAEKTR